jgi:hypothetical protein
MSSGGYLFTVCEGGLGDFDGPTIGEYVHPPHHKADGSFEQHPEQGSTIEMEGVERKVVDYLLNPEAGTSRLVVEPLD